MSKRLIAVNALLGLLALVFLWQIVRGLSAPRPLPAPPESRLAAQVGAPTPAEPRRRAPDEAAFGVIATKNPFNPSRSEAAGAAASPAAGQKVFLYGVVLDAGRSRAYIEDPASKRVFGYAVGDPVAGGRLERIAADRVVIARPEGPMELMLRDPSKPRAAPPPAVAPTTPSARPGQPVPPLVPRPGIAPQPGPGAGPVRERSPGEAASPSPPTSPPLPPGLLRRGVPALPEPPP
jgi:hypothetical protein